ncbi:Methyltransferase domain-containing protein [Pseudonocardia thermophila]|uniref:Methyltransferase domain-containing protein n=1 Tax=Pseudonocardia thermophila TaxID=1848 RepID=A0A1M6VCK3_PSETH|nr:methyltransferase domain-containing protein [Pseudonocardia thermophila]SHK79104.1 Methyltransferase domain-containing protein [Pseudonocardia thermophila]
MPTDGPRGWGAPLHARVLDDARVGPGTTVLDLGCGTGEFAAAAVARGAVLTGIDRDPAAVATAAATVPSATFAVGDVHDPPPGRFDVVAAVQVLIHAANPLVVLRAAAARGVLVSVTTWGTEAECDVRAFGEALAPWLQPRRPPAGPPPVTDPDRLLQLARLAGLGEPVLAEVVCPFHYQDADALVAPLFETGIGRHAINRAGPGAVREAVLQRCAEFAQPDGSYVLHNRFRVLTGRGCRPG